MAQTETELRRDAELGKPKLRQAGRWGGSVTISLTGFLKEGEYYSVAKQGDIVTIAPVPHVDKLKIVRE